MFKFLKGQDSTRDQFLQLKEVSKKKKIQSRQQQQEQQEQQQKQINQDEDEVYNTTTRKSNLSKIQDPDKIQLKKLVSNSQKKAQKFFQFDKIDQQSNLISQQNEKKGDPSYDPLDLTYTLLITEINIIISGTAFFLLVALRYYTLGCLIYVVLKAPDEWQWIFVIIFIRIWYFILVLRVSLKSAQTKTQIILKTYWNSKQVQVHELFQVIDNKMLITCICRALIPPQLSFIYIKTNSQKKRFEIFTAINYIYSSMQMVVYYPFFIIYCAIINPDNNYSLNVINPNFTIFLASAGQAILITLSTYLLLLGFQKKYGSLNYFSNKKFNDKQITQQKDRIQPNFVSK